MLENCGKLKNYTTNPMELPLEMVENNFEKEGNLHQQTTYLFLKVVRFIVIAATIAIPSIIFSFKSLNEFSDAVESSVSSSELAEAPLEALELAESIYELKKKASLKKVETSSNKLASIFAALEKSAAYLTFGFISTALKTKRSYDEYCMAKKYELLSSEKKSNKKFLHLKKSLFSLAKLSAEVALFSLATMAYIFQATTLNITYLACFSVKMLNEVFIHKIDHELLDLKKHKILPLEPYTHASCNQL